MKIHVKLFSILRQYCPDYDPEKGVVVELPGQASAADLIAFFKIPEKKAPVLSCNGRILKATDLLEDGCLVHIFQPVAGG